MFKKIMPIILIVATHLVYATESKAPTAPVSPILSHLTVSYEKNQGTPTLTYRSKDNSIVGTFKFNIHKDTKRCYIRPLDKTALSQEHAHLFEQALEKLKSDKNITDFNIEVLADTKTDAATDAERKKNSDLMAFYHGADLGQTGETAGGSPIMSPKKEKARENLFAAALATMKSKQNN